MDKQGKRSHPKEIYFVTQFNSLAQGGLGRYEQSLFPYLKQITGSRLVRVEPCPIPRPLLIAARLARRDIQSVARNYPCCVPDSCQARLIHLSHSTLALSLLFQRFERTVVTVHDIIPYVQRASHRFGDTEMTGFWDRVMYRVSLRCLRKADRLIAVSAQTQADLVKHFRIPESSIDVVPSGVDRQVFRALPVPPSLYSRYGLSASEHYILYVGSQEARKNLSSLYRALHEVRKHHPGIRLLVAGPARSALSRTHPATFLKGFEQDHLVRFLGFVSEQDLVFLYNLSRVLVLPSVYEGFGLPALEAMACHCPVIASNTTALPEVIGDAGLLVNPYDVNAWVEAIGSALENQSLRRQLIEAGKDRACRFSWAATAEATSAVYRKALN